MTLLGATTVTRLRYDDAGVSASGVLDRGTATETDIIASVQGLPGNGSVILPEGMRETDGLMVYTYSELRASRTIGGEAPADRILYDGLTYEVIDVRRLPAFAGEARHYEAVAMLVLPHERTP